jgi:hypothetical protein
MLLFILLTLVSVSALDETWVAQLAPGDDGPTFAREHGFTYVKRLDFLPEEDNFHVFLVHTSSRARAVNVFRDKTLVAERQAPRMQYKRSSRYPNGGGGGVADPLYESQWHLHTHPFSVDADYAWANGGVTGRGVTIAIVDDGLQHAHPDLKANYDASHSWDFNDNDPEPTPVSSQDGHGTAAAGVAAAVANNGHCGRGVAPSARLVGLRTIAAGVTDLVEAQALSHNAIGTVDIYSCSWGPADDGMTLAGPGPVVQHTLASYAGQLRGRLGKGTIYVWAGGNGRAQEDSCAFDGYASSIFVNCIGAIDYNGNQAWYSEGCAALMGVTPSSGAMRGITTVDLMGNAGYDPGECTATFGGTSSSAPLAAGIIALLLEARPDLTWRDVKHVIAKGALPIQVEQGEWHMNAAGYRHSHIYGFGLLKAPILLAFARNHTLVPPRFEVCRTPLITYTGGSYYIPVSVNVSMTGCNLTFIEHVAILVGMSHERRGNVILDLTSPEGATSHLATYRSKDWNTGYGAGGWTFTSVHHWGERTPNGNWLLAANDQQPDTQGRGHLNAVRLEIYGY